jgi:hypothetical protein
MSDSGTCDTERVAKTTIKKKSVRMKPKSKAVGKSLATSCNKVQPRRELKRSGSATRFKVTTRKRVKKAKTVLDEYEDSDKTDGEEEAVFAAVGLAGIRRKGGRYVSHLNLLQP